MAFPGAKKPVPGGLDVVEKGDPNGSVFGGMIEVGVGGGMESVGSGVKPGGNACIFKISGRMATKMHPDLTAALDRLRARRNFSPEQWVREKIVKLNEYMHSTLKACVVNLSGGIDSAATFALISAAMKEPSSPIKRLLGIMQPICSTVSIQDRAKTLDHFGEIITIDQSEIYNALVPLIEQSTGIKANFFANGNLRSYMRTPVAFYVAQLLSQEGTPAVVVGTGNYDEDGFLFYFSKAGDGVSDIQLIADLHKSEVFSVARYLGVSQSILDAPPSADLWPGQTDENEIGASYDFVELYVSCRDDTSLRAELLANVSSEALEQFSAVGATLEAIHNRNKHKEKFPLNV